MNRSCQKKSTAPFSKPRKNSIGADFPPEAFQPHTFVGRNVDISPATARIKVPFMVERGARPPFVRLLITCGGCVKIRGTLVQMGEQIANTSSFPGASVHRANVLLFARCPCSGSQISGALSKNWISTHWNLLPVSNSFLGKSSPDRPPPKTK